MRPKWPNLQDALLPLVAFRDTSNSTASLSYHTSTSSKILILNTRARRGTAGVERGAATNDGPRPSDRNRTRWDPQLRESIDAGHSINAQRSMGTIRTGGVRQLTSGITSSVLPGIHSPGQHHHGSSISLGRRGSTSWRPQSIY